RALLFLVLVLAEVHDPADRRVRGRRDLDQVEALLFRNRQSLRRRHDAELRPGVVDYSDFSHADTFVNANAVVSARCSVECDNYLPLTNWLTAQGLWLKPSVLSPRPFA